MKRATKRVASGEKERVFWNWNLVVVVVSARASTRERETSNEVWQEKDVGVGFMFGRREEEK